MRKSYKVGYHVLSKSILFLSGVFVGIRYCDTLVSLQSQAIAEIRPASEIEKRQDFLEDLVTYVQSKNFDN